MNQRLFKDACKALWGPRWVSEAARELGLGLRTVQRYESGERAVPDSLGERLKLLMIARRRTFDKLLTRL